MPYLRAEGAVSCELGDGAAILDTVANRYYSLNTVGSIIWESLPQPSGDIAAALVARFGVDPARAASDVQALLSDLKREGLIVGSEPS